MLKATDLRKGKVIKMDGKLVRITDFQHITPGNWRGIVQIKYKDIITGTGPGEIFAHRNIANVVNITDMNFLSVLEYAVDALKVKHIIICGHYGCGGVKAAMGHSKPGSFLYKWLYNIKSVYKDHKSELDLYTDEKRRWDRLVELNVMEQVQNLARTSIVQKAWHDDKRPVLHGWVFGLHDGLIKDLVEVQPGGITDDVYTFDFE